MFFKKIINSIPFKLKLFLGFIIIIGLGAFASLSSIRLMNDTSQLVYTTYDKTLMSGQFSQAAKFDYSQYDSLVESAVLSKTQESFEEFKKDSFKAFNTLKDDLEVVYERSLSEQKEKLYKSIKKSLLRQEKFQNEIFTKKIKLFEKKNSLAQRYALYKLWNENSTTDKLYKSLNRLFDDSAENGYIFRLDSEEKNIKNMKTLEVLGIVSISLSILLALLISYIVISPLRKLDQACQEVDEGDYSVRSDIQSKDEFGHLSNSFNDMLSTIEKKDQSMETLLKALPYGVFYFDESGSISKERSSATDNIFKSFKDYKNIVDFYSSNGANSNSVMDVVNTAYMDVLPFDSAVYLLPQRLNISFGDKDQIIDLEYKEDRDSSKKLKRIIIIARDVTAFELAKKESQELTQKVERVASVSSDTPGFKRFIHECNCIFRRLEIDIKEASSDQIIDIKRDLHSLKGMMFIFNFNAVADLIHNVESTLSSGDAIKFNQQLAQVSGRFKAQYKEVMNILGLDFDQRYKYYDSLKVQKIKSLIDKSNKELYELTQGIDRLPLNKVLAKYFSYAEKLSSSLEDKKFELKLDSQSEVSMSEIEGLDNSFTHIIRNCIDHGIETIDERLSLNKVEKGEVFIFTKRVDKDSLKFVISDDGKGIDGEALVLTALKKGIITQDQAQNFTYQDKLNLIFAAGFSSKDSVTQMSGRGIGMDVVKSEIESLGGSINVHSIIGKGTQFEIELPNINQG